MNFQTINWNSAISSPFYSGKTGTLANSEDPDEMPHKASFHQGLHCLLRKKQMPGTGIHF